MTFTFFLSRKASFSTHQICLSLSLQDRSTVVHKFRLPLFISLEDWDAEKQRPVNIYCKKYKKLNVLLNRMKISIAELIKVNPGISFRTLSKSIKEICMKIEPAYDENSFLFLMNAYLKQKKNTVCLSTYRRYQVFVRLMEKFEGFLCRHIFPEEINSGFLAEFYAFGREEEYTESTLNRSAEFIKTILNFAEAQGIRTYVRQLHVPKVRTARKIIVLDDKDIKKISESRIPKSLQQAKDWLLISCYTGQRISDFMRFHAGQLLEIDGRKCISFVQQKTGKEIMLPLHPAVLKIMKKYGNVFPAPLDQHIYNEQIKNIGALAKINVRVKIRKRIGFRGKEIENEKWENISSHIGRRSFASNFYGRIPTPLLMQATGHSTEQMFLNYINPVNHARVISLHNYFEKIYTESA